MSGLHKNGLSTIIVGAGPSGIAAATKLYENGISNFIILEAEDRIGGRINSVLFGDGIVDVGAEYCHGEEGNVVYNLVKDLDVLERVKADVYSKFYFSTGSKIDDSLGSELLCFAFTFSGSGEGGEKNSPAISYGDDFIATYNATIKNKYEHDPEKSRVVNAAIGYSENIVRMMEGSFSWFDSLEPKLKPYKRCPGDQFMLWKGCGYKTVLDVMMKKYPNPEEKLNIDDKILLKKKVTKIVWGEDGVKVECWDRTTYAADHLIFTASIGVLKKQHKQLFEPSLPLAKQEAIDAIGFEGVMKVIMQFPKKWWNDDDLTFSFVWSDENAKSAAEEFSDGPMVDGKSWVCQIFTLIQVSNNPTVLVSWITSSLVPEIEQLPLEMLKEGFTYTIKKFLGKDYDVTAPERIFHSSWCTNPHFGGTYSYERVKAFKENVSPREQLALPLVDDEGVPVVLFAGEATNPIHYSTIHGAIETGYREAERLLNLKDVKSH